MPIGANSDVDELRRVVNANFAQLDTEAVAKQFKGSGGATMLNGVMQDGRFGTLMQVDGVDRHFVGFYREGRFGIISYDDDGVPITLDGMDPVDGHVGKWQVKPGENVITKLGG